MKGRLFGFPGEHIRFIPHHLSGSITIEYDGGDVGTYYNGQSISITPGKYTVIANSESGYPFLRWLTGGEIKVVDPTNPITTIHVNGDGDIKA